MIALFDINPKPIIVSDGEFEILTIKSSSFTEFSNCKIQIVNKNQSAAELFDNNQTSDIIQSDPFDVKTGDFTHQYQVGFKLQQNNISSGANITLKIYFVDSTGKVISNVFSLKTLIASQ
jgi:hypothetical protein